MGLFRTIALVSSFVVVGCGGKVEDDHTPPPPPPPHGTDGGATSGGPGSGSGTSTGGGACPLPAPRPEYPICYSTMYPPCLVASDPALAKRVSGLSPSPTGPWVAADPTTCAMLCCYGP